MPSDNRAKHFGSAAAAGAAIAGGGYLVRSAADDHLKAARANHAMYSRDRADAERKLVQVRGNKAAGVPKGTHKTTGKPLTWDSSIKHAEHRVGEARINANIAQLKTIKPMRVKRIGSGVLGAGATLATLGAVAAERSRRKPGKLVPKAKPAAPAARPLKDYRAMVHDGIPTNVSPRAASDWLRANDPKKVA